MPSESTLDMPELGQHKAEEQEPQASTTAALPRLAQRPSLTGSASAHDDKTSVDESGCNAAAVPGNKTDHSLPRRPWRPHVTAWDDIASHTYKGSGTNEDPFLVEWLPQDPENPLTLTSGFKAQATFTAAFSCLAVSMCSSMLSAAIIDIRMKYPGLSNEMYIMGT